MKKQDRVGIDVSARSLEVRLERGRTRRRLEVSNDVEGHRKLTRLLTKGGRSARVALEATGVYHLDLARALQASTRIEVMVVNPAVMRDFARALVQRSKTDVDDAEVALEFVGRMPFASWAPPPQALFDLRALARRISGLIDEATAERNRLHAVRQQAGLIPAVAEDLREHVAFLEQRIAQLEKEAKKVIGGEVSLLHHFELLLTAPGIAERSAIRILAEIGGLPKDMKVRQWVAHAGLDPCRYESGTSVHRPPRISRRGNARLRAALYMPALVAIRHDPHIRGFYDHLLAAGKAKLQALTAVMRKLLHAVFGMFASGTAFQGSRFYAQKA